MVLAIKSHYRFMMMVVMVFLVALGGGFWWQVLQKSIAEHQQAVESGEVVPVSVTASFCQTATPATQWLIIDGRAAASE